jgi:hypothetical protein
VFDPISIAIMIAIGALATGAVYVALLTLDYLIDWFRDRAASVQSNPEALAVTVAQELSSGRVNYVQGIFDQENGSFIEARRIRTDAVDDQVRQAHTGNRVTVWS